MSVILALVACGGGGGDASEPKQAAAEPSKLNVENLIVKPSYSGNRELIEIKDSDKFTLSLDMITMLDMLNVLTFSNVYNHYFILPENRNNQPTSSDCVSGELIVNKISETHLQAKYNNCLEGGITSNGSLDIVIRQRNNSGLFDMDIIPNISIETYQNKELLKIEGYFKVRQATSPSDRHQATYQLLFTNELADTVYLDDFKITVSEQFKGIRYDGAMYFSEFGKLNISTDSSEVSDEITLNIDSGNKFKVQVQPGVGITVNADESIIPVNANFDSIPNSVFDDVNVVPEAVITFENETVQRNEKIVLDSSLSKDGDFDLLTPQWSVIKSPDGAVWNIGAGHSPEFDANIPGIYTISLSVTDSKGAISSTTHELIIKKSPASVELVLEKPITLINQEMIGAVTILNDSHDGPFDFRVVYGPDDLSVDSNGRVQWDVSIPNFGVVTNVKYAIAVSNSDTTKVFEYSIPVEPAENTSIDSWISSINQYLPSWSDTTQIIKDGDKEKLLASTNYSNIPTLITLNDDNLLEMDWAVPVVEAGLTYLRSYDVDDDGILDDFFVRDDGERVDGKFQPQWALLVKNGKSKKLTKLLATDLFMNEAADFGILYFTDFDNDGEKELTIFSNPAQHTTTVHSYSLIDFAYLFSVDLKESLVGMCDIDNDGYTDVITTDQAYSIKKEEVLFQFVDYDNNSKLLEANSNCYIFDGSKKVLSFNNDKISEVFVSAASSMHVGNFDSDPDQEVLYFESVNITEKQWYVGEVGTGGSISSTPIAKFDNEYVITPLVVMNVDGDGADEIVVSKRDRNTDSVNLAAYKISKSGFEINFLQKYGGTKTTYSPNSEFEETIIETYGHFLDSDFESNELFFYKRFPNPVSVDEFIKYSSVGNKEWGILDGAISSMDASQLSDFVVAGQDYSSEVSLIDKNTGEIAPWKFHSMFTSPRGTVDEIIVDYKATSIFQLNDNELNILEIGDGIKGLLGSIYNDYDLDFIQYDSDQELELVIKERLSDSSTVSRIFDTKNWQEESRLPGDDGLYANLLAHPVGKENKCSLELIDCRNVIYLHGNWFSVVDKISNQTIYRSPLFGGAFNNVDFEKNKDETRRIVINKYKSVGYVIH